MSLSKMYFSSELKFHHQMTLSIKELAFTVTPLKDCLDTFIKFSQWKFLTTVSEIQNSRLAT